MRPMTEMGGKKKMNLNGNSVSFPELPAMLPTETDMSGLGLLANAENAQSNTDLLKAPTQHSKFLERSQGSLEEEAKRE